MTCPSVVVVGASAGGLQAVLSLLSSLPADFPSAVFIVIHRGPDGPAVLPGLLAKQSPLPVRVPDRVEQIRPGHVYLPPLDCHLLIGGVRVRPTHGPRQHGFRPAIDPLFISAAEAYGDCVAGVVLSGALDDGTAGLLAIKRHGGFAIVQDPEEALVPSMPLNAMKDVDVDAVLKAAEIGPCLVELTRDSAGSRRAVNERPRLAGNNAMATTLEPEGGRSLTPFTCPSCGGALWEIEQGALDQYECHVGHRYGIEALKTLGDDRTEDVLWSAVRALQEAAALRRRMAERATSRGVHVMARRWQEDAAASQRRANQVRALIEAMNGAAESEEAAATRPRRKRTTRRKTDGRTAARRAKGAGRARARA